MGGLISIAIGALGAAQSIASGFAQSRALSLQATQSIRDASIKAETANINAGLQAAKQKQDTLALMSKQVVQGAAAGVDVTDTNSSLINLITTSQKEAETEREIMLSKGRLEAATALANGYSSAASQSRGAKSAKRFGLLSGALSLGAGLYKAGAFDNFSNIFSSGEPGAFINKPLIESNIRPYVPTWRY